MTESEQQHVFHKWIDQYQVMILKIVRAYAPTHLDETDLFQEISIQLWLSIPRFKQLSSESTWIYRIALNTALKWERDQRKLTAQTETLDQIKHHRLLQPVAPLDERLQWVYSELKKLDKIDRSICLLLLDGFSYTEISEIMGITESNVGVKLHRIKKHLKNRAKTYKPYGT